MYTEEQMKVIKQAQELLHGANLVWQDLLAFEVANIAIAQAEEQETSPLEIIEDEGVWEFVSQECDVFSQARDIISIEYGPEE